MNESNELDFDDSFAESLRRDLRDLARAAPAAPGEVVIRRALRGRRLRRLGLALGVGAAAGVLVYLGLRGPIREDGGPEITKPTTIPGPGIEALPANANRREVLGRLLAYFKGIDGVRGFLSKTPGDGLSLALSSSSPLKSRDLGGELERLLRNFDYVKISISDEDFRFSLMRF